MAIIDSSEWERKKMEFEVHWSFLQQLILARSGSIPLIGSIAAALLVVVSFNEDIIRLNETVSKLILGILLGVVGISIVFFVWEISVARNKTQKFVEDLIGRSIEPKARRRGEILRDQILDCAPWVFAFLIFGVTASLIYLLI